MRKRIGVLPVAVLVAILVLTAGCTPKPAAEQPAEQAPAAGDTIRIGVFEPMTGDSAAGGQMTWEGIQLAWELHPQVLGKKVDVKLVDNKTDKNEAANAVARLIEKEKVVAIIGSYGSSLSMSAGPIVLEKKVPAVGCSPTNPLVTKDNPYYFRVCFIDPFQGKVMAKYATENLRAETAVIIRNVADAYSVGLCNYFKEAFVKLTGNEKAILAELDYQQGDQDFTAQLTTVKTKNPDVIFAPGPYNDGALMIKQARSLGIKAAFLGGDTWEAPEFIQIGGKDVEGVALSTHYSVDAAPTEAAKEFVAAYKKKYDGKAPNAFAALGYDAYMVILDAIERAGSPDPVAVRDTLAETADFKGVTGTITLDENGDATKSAVILQVQNGQFKYLTTVEPE
ncbi:MAG TPA: ABC transporter substrate-binding protein [Firmicutes bacterium]|nr:ABC transporter substrate-binding protein [Bacillota bacterium]